MKSKFNVFHLGCVIVVTFVFTLNFLGHFYSEKKMHVSTLLKNSKAFVAGSLKRDKTEKDTVILKNSIYHFHKSKCPQKHKMEIAIVQMAVGDNYINNEVLNALQSMRCYARMRGYTLYQFNEAGQIINNIYDQIIAKNVINQCSQYKGLLRKRHCISAKMLHFYTYVIHIDADSGVVNPNHCFEEFINPNVDMHFLLRVHTGEIQAGHYIVKNTTLSQKFLLDWANFTKAGTDQPRLHMKLSETFLSPKEHSKCLIFYKKDYWKWINCIISTMRIRTSIDQQHLLIYSRAQSFVRDGWANNFRWSNHDFMFHAMKRQDDVVFTRKLRPEDCENDIWVIPSKKELYVASVTEMQEHWKTFDKKYYPSKQFAIDKGISHCWPNCKHLLV